MNREGYEDYMKRRLKEEEVSSVIKEVGKLSVLDHVKLEEAERSYGDSWKQRGGVGAFMMLARKWDRLEKQVNECNFDVFKAINEDGRDEGIIDDIRDLRRYLFLVEAEMVLRSNGRKQK